MKPDELTTEAVQRKLKTTRSRTVQYLCRAYLQFGPDTMDKSHLEALAKAVSKT